MAEKISFGDYKKTRKSVTDIISQIQENSGSSKPKDERLFQYTLDKSGNALIVLRFIDSQFATAPMIETFTHYVEVNDRKFFRRCPTTNKGKCPICEDNKRFFGDGASEATQNIGRKRCRKKGYAANIVVLKDSTNPDNDGKQFIWKFGYKVYEKIMGQLKADFDGDATVPVFDYQEGATFKLRLKTVNKYINYDSSEFMTASPLVLSEDEKENQDKLEKLFGATYDLSEFKDPKLFDPYDKIKEDYTTFLVEAGEKVSANLEQAEKKFEAPEKKEPTVKEETPFEGSDNSSDDDYFDNI